MSVYGKLKMARSVWYHVLMVGFVVVSVHTAEDEKEKKAWACYGNFRNFLDISCPQNRQVKLLSMMDGAKPTNQNCPDVTTGLDNFRSNCCSFAQGDCVIWTHPNNFPVECSQRPFCRPQSRRADTEPKCNSKDFPKFTHYTEITYRCIIPPVTTSTTSTTTTTSTATTTTTTTSSMVTNGTHSRKTSVRIPTSTTPGGGISQLSTANSSSSSSSVLTVILHSSSTNVYTGPPLTHKSVDESDDDDDFTPAMIGGMLAGIVGLVLTIFIFMFYWGRKRQIRISGKNQSNVWDFLLSNTMSVRAFRGYDNFSSSSYSQGSEKGSPGVRKTMWLPNISLDSGQGHSNVTSDDNCSVVTVERHPTITHAPATSAVLPTATANAHNAAATAAAATTATTTVANDDDAYEASRDHDRHGRGVQTARLDTANGTAVAGFAAVATPGESSGAGDGDGGRRRGGESTLEEGRSSSDPETGVELRNAAMNNL